ncbi:hypothetical protein CDCA_CDCA11G3100 [Cyanidium caldarium]|uniref:Uncharacterized protein n=1 Tax=Cyanidium caldarium TaxID=2771 RepID=A0AAV9IYA9_CYACA|nr:hypothetical protein CDCA_CDCA11G3100 [Cyanidium caldarium]
MDAVKRFFGVGETPEQKLRKYKRTIDRAVREVDRERIKMQRVEQQRKNEIRKLARDGQHKSMRIAARDLVRVRNNVARMYEVRSQMQSVQMQLSSMRSSEAMTEAVRGIVKSMRLMNRQVNLPRINAILQEFERENEILGMKQEVLDDAMENAVVDDDETEETDEVVNQVLDELGLENASRLGNAPPTRRPEAMRKPQRATGQVPVLEADAGENGEVRNGDIGGGDGGGGEGHNRGPGSSNRFGGGGNAYEGRGGAPQAVRESEPDELMERFERLKR